MHPLLFLPAEVSHDGIASISKYNHIRIRDGSLQTSTSNQFMYFVFDVKINCKLNHNSSKIVFKRDFEHLMKGIIGY